MQAQSITVHCTYADNELILTQLIEESFRAYLRRILAPGFGTAV